MENEQDLQPVKDPGPQRSKNAEKQANYRARKDGLIPLTKFQEIKQEIKKLIKQNSNFDIQQFLTNPLCIGISHEERHKLIDADRKRIKGQRDFIKAQSITEEIQANRNLTLQEELCAALTKEDRVDVLLAHNRQNPIAFSAYLLSLKGHPVQEFLPILISVINEEAHELQKLRIFLTICGLYKGEKLYFDLSLCSPFLEYMTYQECTTDKQALGFLRFLFQNNVGLQGCSLQTLLDFDTRYMHIFSAFHCFLQGELSQFSRELIGILPHTILMISAPLIKALKISGNVFAYIPSEFIKPVIDILVYCFDSSEDAFNSLSQKLKNSFIDNIEKMRSTNFGNFLYSLSHRLMKQDQNWYQKLDAVSNLIEGSIKMLEERKIKYFDDKVCESLLTKLSIPDEYLQQPSILKQSTKNNKQQILDQLLTLNKQNKNGKALLKNFMPDQTLSTFDTQIYEALKIKPHSIQELATQVLAYSVDIKNKFLVIGAGLGKTKFILAQASKLVRQSKLPVIILNFDERLLLRDFSASVQFACDLKVQIDIAEPSTSGITYMTVTDYLKCDLPSHYHLIVDEYHTIFFNPILVFKLLPFISKAISFTGISGSPLTYDHEQFLEQALNNAVIIKFTEAQNYALQSATVCKTQNEQFKQIIEAISILHQDQKQWAPIVVILEPAAGKAFTKQGKQCNLSITNLLEHPPQEIDAILKMQFNQPIDKKGKYGIYVIDESMGTGTDFLSSSLIEVNGGVVLMICTKPINTMMFAQLNSRTGRIWNKGRRFYIVNDSKYIGLGENYLQTVLRSIQIQELLQIKNLQRTLKDIQIKSCQSVHQHDDQLPNTQKIKTPFRYSNGDLSNQIFNSQQVNIDKTTSPLNQDIIKPQVNDKVLQQTHFDDSQSTQQVVQQAQSLQYEVQNVEQPSTLHIETNEEQQDQRSLQNDDIRVCEEKSVIKVDNTFKFIVTQEEFNEFKSTQNIEENSNHSSSLVKHDLIDKRYPSTNQQHSNTQYDMPKNICQQVTCIKRKTRSQMNEGYFKNDNAQSIITPIAMNIKKRQEKTQLKIGLKEQQMMQVNSSLQTVKSSVEIEQNIQEGIAAPHQCIPLDALMSHEIQEPNQNK